MKTMTMEEMLNWAFVHELPKGGGVEGLANAYSAWGTICELGTRVDTSGYRDGGNFFIDQGEPNPDALLVGRCVAALGQCDIAVPPGWNPLADWAGHADLVEASVARVVEVLALRGAVKRGEGIVALVVGCAVLGRAPDWTSQPSGVRMVERNGRPAWFVKRQRIDNFGQPFEFEGDGLNPKTGRPVGGAYRRYEFATDPAGDILARLDWQVRVAALRRLEETLTGALAGHSIAPSPLSMTPWLAQDIGGVSLVETGRAAMAIRSSRARTKLRETLQ